MALYCQKTNPFSVEEALHILTHPDDQRIVTDAPVRPKAGDVFLYSFRGSPQKKDDWRCDQYTWLHCGVRLLPKKDPKLRKFYHVIKRGSHHGNFTRHGYTLLDPSSQLVLVHYLGDEKEYQPLPHGDRKKNLTRPHIRRMPLVTGNTSDKNVKPSKAYQDLCNNAVTEPARIPVTQPRDLEQIRNKLKRERRRAQVSHDDLYRVLELTELLEGFIHDFSLNPTLYIVMGLREIMSEIGEIVSLKTDLPMFFSYDATFQLGEFYLSTLLFRNVLFIESPPIPVMFVICDTRREENHKRFFESVPNLCPFLNSEKVVIVSDGEKGVEKALDHVFIKTQREVCWNPLRRDITFWLKKHGASSEETKVYLAGLLDLLRSNSEEEYTVKVEKLCRKWSKAFLDFFEEEIHQAIITHAGAWMLKRFKIDNEKSGIATNMSESFHVALKRFSQGKEMTMEATVLSLYAMQNFYWRETLRGLCNTGNLHLRTEFMWRSRAPEDTVFPHVACDPSQIMDLVQRRELPQPEKDASYEKAPFVCQVALADFTVLNNLISLCPQLGVFVVRGTKEQSYVVRLFPKESCSCPSSRTCYHIMAAKKSIGMPVIPGKPRRLPLPQLKRNKKQKTRSGRKFPRLRENTTVVPASDSIPEAEEDEPIMSHRSLTTSHVVSTPTQMTSNPKHGKKKLPVADQVTSDCSCCSVAQSSPTLCDPLDLTTPSPPVFRSPPKLTQFHVCGIDNTVQPSHPLTSPSSLAFNLSQTSDSATKLSRQSENCPEKSQDHESVPPWHNCTFETLGIQDRGLLSSVANTCVYDYDMDTLRGSGWLNDRVIDAFLASRVILAKELGHDGTIFPLSCHVMQTLLSERLSAQTLKYCLKYRVLWKDILFIPVNDGGVHWILIVIIFKRKTLLYLDSIHGLNRSVIHAVTSFLARLYELELKRAYSFADWSFHAPTDIPRQENSSDCGPFTCAIAHLIASGVPLKFTQNDMAAIRPWIAQEIVKYSGKTYLVGRERYIPQELARVPSVQKEILNASGITVSRSCPRGWTDTLTYCSDILPTLLEGRRSRCFLKEGCLRPRSDFSMVYCEGKCKDWYHCFCLGLASKAPPQVFMCPDCESTVAK